MDLASTSAWDRMSSTVATSSSLSTFLHLLQESKSALVFSACSQFERILTASPKRACAPRR